MSRNASLSPLSATPSLHEVETLARSFEVQGLRLTRTAGVLVMEGRVPCYSTKKLAGKTAARLFGAARVVNRLRVVPLSHRGDAELADAVRAELASLGREDIAVSVYEGIVTLQGSVPSPAIRGEAEAASWALRGVADVENRLRVRQFSTRNGQGR